jgi:uncharacterized membrane protein
MQNVCEIASAAGTRLKIVKQPCSRFKLTRTRGHMTKLEHPPASNLNETVVEMGRLKGLSDAVFAFAITLLVLEIRIPGGVLAGDLTTHLVGFAPKGLVYLLSFIVIGGAWGSHQRMISQINVGDGLLVCFNLFSLLFVTLLPASATQLGRFPNSFLAITCFAVDVVLIQLTALWLWQHAGRQGLTTPTLDPRAVIGIGRRPTLSAVIFGSSIRLALLNSTVAYLIWIGMFMLLFATDWLSWQLAASTQPDMTPLAGASQAHIHIEFGMGQLNIGATSPSPALLEGVFGGGLKKRIDRTQDVLHVWLKFQQRRGFMSLRFPWAWRPADASDWTINLNRDIPVELEIASGWVHGTPDLTDLQIAPLNIEASASSLQIGMPAHASRTAVPVNAATTSLPISVPPDVAASIQTTRAMASAEIDTTRFPKVAENEYRSANYPSAANRADIRLELAFGSVKVA